MRILLSLLSVLLFQSFALADANHTQLISYLQKHRGLQISSVEGREILNWDRNLFAIDESLHEQLLSIAQSQSEIWGDTILEGDVAALGDIELIGVEELWSDQDIEGYRITYAQRGWDTSTCDLSRAGSDDYQNPETFAQCAEGKIIESAYVTGDLSTYFADVDGLAHLVLN